MVGLPRLSNTSKALISTILLMRSFTPFVQEKISDSVSLSLDPRLGNCSCVALTPASMQSSAGMAPRSDLSECPRAVTVYHFVHPLHLHQKRLQLIQRQCTGTIALGVIRIRVRFQK